MDQRWLRYFMPAAVSKAEDERQKPFEAGFAGTGNSGMSYGAMQNDIRTNPEAEETFRQILGQHGIDPSRINQIVEAGKQRGITEDKFKQLVPGAIGQIKDALTQNPGMVGDQDASSAFWTRSKMANALGGANTNPNGPGELGENPNARLFAKVGGWLNRTGDKEAAAVRKFLHDTPNLTESAFDEWLKGRPYFQNNGSETVEGWTGRLDRAVPVGLEAYNNAPPPPQPEVRLWNSETDAGPVPGNLFNSNALPENLLNMPDHELRKWGIR